MRSCQCTYELSVAALVEVRSGPREHGVVLAMGSVKYDCVLVIVSHRYIFVVLLTFFGGIITVFWKCQAKNGKCTWKNKIV